MRDLDVRLAIRSQLQREHHRDPDTRIVEEMGIWNGTVRVDLAVINGELIGYEIKSAKDTLTRLPTQAALYSAVFDRVHLVAAEKHLARAQQEIPTWWGLITASPASDGLTLDVVRAACTNPNVNPLQIARLLWREEAMSLLDQHNASRGVRRGTREMIAVRLTETLTLDELRDEVRRCLKRRPAWLGEPVGNQ